MSLTVSINGENIRIESEGLQSFGKLMQRIEAEFISPANQVITAVVLNGQELDEVAEKDFAELPLQRIISLALSSADPKELVFQSLGSVGEIFQSLKQQADKVIQLHEAMEERRSMQEFILLAEGLNWFSSVFRGTQTVLKEPIQTLGLSNHPFFTEGEALLAQMRELLAAQESQDRTLFRDLMEYEVSPRLEAVAKAVEPLIVALNRT